MIRVFIFLCLFSGSVAFAHQQKAAITQVLFNERSGYLEISHRFYLHDAEHAVQEMGLKGADIHDDKDTQLAFYHYVLGRFSLSLSSKPLELESLGYEIEGTFFWIYQQASLPKEESSLTIQHSALMDIWPDQINTVNIERSGEVSTAVFDRGVLIKEIHFD